MDSWPQEQHRQKRTFDQMSQPTTLSPSSSLFFGARASPQLDNSPIFLDRRRLSHPHNQSSRVNYLSPDIMADRFLPHPRPSLEHRTSQTIIDLTEDSELAERRRPAQQSPPVRLQLQRSESQDIRNFIDLTDDPEEDDVEITGTRSVSVVAVAEPAHRRHRRRIRAEPDPLDGSPMFVPDLVPHQTPPFMQRIMHLIPGFHQHAHLHRLLDQEMPHVQMPGVLNYAQHAFVHPEPLKPPHQAPPAAQPGFTRSPAEDDTVICPSCEQELITKNGEEPQPLPKKTSNRPQTKKDREEHPFWVVRECGHVYCNDCYQHRRPDRKSDPKSLQARFPEGRPESKYATGRKMPMCAVEGCKSEVGHKSSWIGIFL